MEMSFDRCRKRFISVLNIKGEVFREALGNVLHFKMELKKQCSLLLGVFISICIGKVIPEIAEASGN